MQITNIERYGDHGWTWKVEFSDIPVSIEFRTDEDGQGLWNRVTTAGYTWKQRQGYAQFCLQANNEPEAREAIKLFHTEFERRTFSGNQSTNEALRLVVGDAGAMHSAGSAVVPHAQP